MSTVASSRERIQEMVITTVVRREHRDRFYIFPFQHNPVVNEQASDSNPMHCPKQRFEIVRAFLKPMSLARVSLHPGSEDIQVTHQPRFIKLLCRVTRSLLHYLSGSIGGDLMAENVLQTTGIFLGIRAPYNSDLAMSGITLFMRRHIWRTTSDY